MSAVAKKSKPKAVKKVKGNKVEKKFVSESVSIS